MELSAEQDVIEQTPAAPDFQRQDKLEAGRARLVGIHIVCSYLGRLRNFRKRKEKEPQVEHILQSPGTVLPQLGAGDSEEEECQADLCQEVGFCVCAPQPESPVRPEQSSKDEPSRGPEPTPEIAAPAVEHTIRVPEMKDDVEDEDNFPPAPPIPCVPALAASQVPSSAGTGPPPPPPPPMSNGSAPPLPPGVPPPPPPPPMFGGVVAQDDPNRKVVTRKLHLKAVPAHRLQ